MKKRKRLQTIGSFIATIKTGKNLQKRRLLEEILQFQFLAEPINPDWPINAKTRKRLIDAIQMRAMERAKKSLDLGDFKDVAQLWQKAALDIVLKIKQLAY